MENPDANFTDFVSELREERKRKEEEIKWKEFTSDGYVIETDEENPTVIAYFKNLGGQTVVVDGYRVREIVSVSTGHHLHGFKSVFCQRPVTD